MPFTDIQKKETEEAHELIKQLLDTLNKQGKIGSWGYGCKSFEQGAWDPKKKKTMSEYMKALFNLKKLAKSGKHPFKFGITHLCTVCNPQNTHQVVIWNKEHKSELPFFHYTDILNYDEFMNDINQISMILEKLDLRGFPENNAKLKMVN